MAEALPSTGASVLVTGATGFLGRHLLRALQRQNRRVVAVVRDEAGLSAAFPGIEIIRSDVRDVAGYSSRLEPGMTVFHLAGTRALPGTRREEFRRVNVDATLALARAAAQAGAGRFMHISTALVYGCASGAPADETVPLREPAFPSGYLESRLEGLRQVRNLVVQGLPVVTLCPTIMFGPDTPDHPNRLARQMRRLLRRRLDVVIGDGAQRRTVAFVDDVVRGMILAEARGAPGEEYILGGHDVSPREFNRLVLAAARATSRLRLSVPAWAVRLVARGADRCRGFERGCGYETALDMYSQEWCYRSSKAVSGIGYGVTPIGQALAETVRALASQQAPVAESEARAG